MIVGYIYLIAQRHAGSMGEEVEDQVKALTHLISEREVQHYRNEAGKALQEAKEETMKRPELLQVAVLHHLLVRLEEAARRASHASKITGACPGRTADS